MFTGNAGGRWSVAVLRVTLRIGSGGTESGESPQAAYLVPSSGIKGIHRHDQLCANDLLLIIRRITDEYTLFHAIS